MTTLTIYTKDFDKYENIVNNGMSGKVFLDMDGQFGREFSSVDEALEYTFINGITVGRIEFNYISGADENGGRNHMFAKFDVAN